MTHPDHIHVTERDGVRTLRIGRMLHSSMRLDDPFDTDFEYPAYFHLAVVFVPDATRTLVIGLGGGSVVKRMWRDYPTMHLDVVEIDSEVARVAREEFALPDDERIRVSISDGREFLEACSDVYDFVFVDAFDGDGVPPHLLTEQFAQVARAHLAEDGVLACNVHGSVTGDMSKAFRSLYRTLRAAFRNVWVFPVGLSKGGPAGEHREVVVLATDSTLTEDELLGRIDSRVDGKVSVPRFDQLGQDLYRESIRGGDVRMLTDPPGTGRSR